jgi:hypothetical protein
MKDQNELKDLFESERWESCEFNRFTYESVMNVMRKKSTPSLLWKPYCAYRIMKMFKNTIDESDIEIFEKIGESASSSFLQKYAERLSKLKKYQAGEGMVGSPRTLQKTSCFDGDQSPFL